MESDFVGSENDREDNKNFQPSSIVRFECLAHFFKGARSYFSKCSFTFNLKDHHTKGVNFKFQLIWSNRLDLVSNFVYCSCL